MSSTRWREASSGSIYRTRPPRPLSRDGVASFMSRRAARVGSRSEIDRTPVNCECGFLHRFGERWMGVTDARDVLARRAKLHGHDAFGDQLRDHGSDRVHTENTIGLGVGEKLDEPLGLAEGAGTAVG